MVTNRQSNTEAQKRQYKKDNLINLTDIGRHNTTQARLVRDLQDDGTYKMRYVNWDGSLIPEENPQDPNALGATEGNNNTPIFIIANEDKGSGYKQPYQPTDIEPGYEEGLKSGGATVHSSTTYYPASKVTTTKRLVTHDEIAAERGNSQYPL
jgi:hypothetical protein